MSEVASSNQEIPIENDTYMIVIPEQGIAAFKSTKPLESWYKPEVTTASGKRITDGSINVLGPGQVAFYPLWTDSDSNAYFYIGTAKGREEVEAAGLWNIDDFIPKGNNKN